MFRKFQGRSYLSNIAKSNIHYMAKIILITKVHINAHGFEMGCPTSSYWCGGRVSYYFWPYFLVHRQSLFQMNELKSRNGPIGPKRPVTTRPHVDEQRTPMLKGIPTMTTCWP